MNDKASSQELLFLKNCLVYPKYLQNFEIQKNAIDTCKCVRYLHLKTFIIHGISLPRRKGGRRGLFIDKFHPRIMQQKDV